MKKQTLNTLTCALSCAASGSFTALAANLTVGSNPELRQPDTTSSPRNRDGGLRRSYEAPLQDTTSPPWNRDGGRMLARRDRDLLYALARVSARDRALENVSWLILATIGVVAVVLGLVP